MLEKFFKMLESDPLRAWYGEGHVLKAAERGAIGKLLISDEIFRSPSVARRKQFVKLVEDVRAYGGEVLIFSSMHESGQREWWTSNEVGRDDLFLRSEADLSLVHLMQSSTR